MISTKQLTDIKTMYITFIAGSNASKENKADKIEHSKPEKFEQVENALEAMFGIEEKSGTPCCVRQFKLKKMNKFLISKFHFSNIFQCYM